jgi:vesicle transport through interaction with t-SNAREs protein 1
MSEVFDGYERQYCEISASLSRKCTAASSLSGGMLSPTIISRSRLELSTILLIDVCMHAEKLKQNASEIKSGIDGAEALVPYSSL